MSKQAKSKLGIFILIFVLAAAAVGAYLFLHRGEESTDDASINGTVVTLSPEVSGYAQVLNITDNKFVKKGDVLLEIDPTNYILRRDQAEAALEAAEAAASASSSNFQTTKVSAPSNLDAARAQVTAAEAEWKKAASDLERMQKLSNEARSQAQLDQTIAAEKSARSNLEDARARLRSAQTAPRAIAAAKANSEELAAKVKQAEADLAQAQQNLDDTKIIAPMDGRITKRNVEKGDYIQPGQALASLVGTSDLWVTANFKETQLTNIKPGQRVTIGVDALGGKSFNGTVDSIQSGTGSYFSTFPPENATGNFVKIVQRVPVKVLFDKQPDASLALGPGMSVEATVHTLGHSQ